MATITLPKNLNAKQLNFSEVKKNAMGGNMVYISYNDSKKLMNQTPQIASPFGLSTYTDEKTGNVKYSIDVSFRGMDEDAKVKMFHDKMQSIDEQLIDIAVENSKEWFGKKMSREVVSELYKPIIKPSKEPEKYAPTMKIKIRNIQTLEAYDDNRNAVVAEDTIVKGSKIRSILESASVWFVNKQFGLSWNMVQVQVSKPEKLSGYSMMEDSDDDEFDAPQKVELQDSDEEPSLPTEEPEDSDEEVTVKASKPAAKRTTKKA